MFDERRVRGLGRREPDRRFGFPVGELRREGPDGLQFVLPDAAAAYDETVFGGVEPPVEIGHGFAREVVVFAFVRRDAVGVVRPEQRPGEGFAGLDIDFRAVDRQPLFAFGGVGAQLLFGEHGAEQNLFRHGERPVEEFREGGEIDIGVVAVDVDIVPRAVVVELFGDLAGRHVARAFGEQIGRRRCREGHLLEGRSGSEDERDAQHFELLRSERVEGDAVGQQRLCGLGDLDLRGGYAGLCHFFVL